MTNQTVGVAECVGLLTDAVDVASSAGGVVGLVIGIMFGLWVVPGLVELWQDREADRQELKRWNERK